jgi:hypothetical protein
MSAMMKNKLSRRAAGTVTAAMILAASAGLAAASASKPGQPRYDGMWSVLVVTEKGDCDRGYRYPIRISHGVLVNAGDSGFTITGKVAQTGVISVIVSHGNSSASGSGRLAGDSGEGSWSGGECSGSWSAERRSS